MQISFIILFMIDLYKDNHLRACMCALVNFFFNKTSQKLLTGLLPNFIVVFLRRRLKSALHCYRKIRPVERYRHSSTSSYSIFCLYGTELRSLKLNCDNLLLSFHYHLVLSLVIWYLSLFETCAAWYAGERYRTIMVFLLVKIYIL